MSHLRVAASSASTTQASPVVMLHHTVARLLTASNDTNTDGHDAGMRACIGIIKSESYCVRMELFVISLIVFITLLLCCLAILKGCCPGCYKPPERGAPQEAPKETDAAGATPAPATGSTNSSQQDDAASSAVENPVAAKC
jgi:hypothetical protein